jgi:hypothetical protein
MSPGAAAGVAATRRSYRGGPGHEQGAATNPQSRKAGANVILAEPYDPSCLSRTIVRDELRVVSPSQLAADLLTGPGREPSQGNELLT